MDYELPLLGLSDDEAEKYIKLYGENKTFVLDKRKSIKFASFENIIYFIFLFVVIFAVYTVFLYINEKSFIPSLLMLLYTVLVGGVFLIFRIRRKKSTQLPQKRIYAKVIRSGVLKAVPAEKLADGDLIRLEKGDIVPALSKIERQFDFSLTNDKPLVVGDTINAGIGITGGCAFCTVIRHSDMDAKETITSNFVSAEDFSENIIKKTAALLCLAAAILAAFLWLADLAGLASLNSNLFKVLSFLALALPFGTFFSAVKIAEKIGNFEEYSADFSSFENVSAVVSEVIGGVTSPKLTLQALYTRGETEDFSPPELPPPIAEEIEISPSPDMAEIKPEKGSPPNNFTAPFEIPSLDEIAEFRRKNALNIESSDNSANICKKPNSPQFLDLLSFAAIASYDEVEFDESNLVLNGVRDAAYLCGIEPKKAKIRLCLPPAKGKTSRTIIAQIASRLFVISIGNLSEIAKFCDKEGSANLLRSASKKETEFYNNGMNVVAVAFKEINYFTENPNREILERHLYFKGLLAFSSEMREDSYAKVKTLSENNVTTYLATGQQKQIAAKCAGYSGVISEKVSEDFEDISALNAFVLTGTELDKMTVDEVKRRISTRVFAELDAEEKQTVYAILAEKYAPKDIIVLNDYFESTDECVKTNIFTVQTNSSSPLIKYISSFDGGENPFKRTAKIIVGRRKTIKKIKRISLLYSLKFLPAILVFAPHSIIFAIFGEVIIDYVLWVYASRKEIR